MGKIIDSLKSQKLPLGVFAGLQKGPSPARIFITFEYSEDFDFLRGVQGFTVKSFNLTGSPVGTVAFEIPVTPPTVSIDTGNEKDSENVTRIGEVVLPKYKKAWQVRWESFFPYDTSAKYLNTTVRNLSSNTWNQLKNSATSAYNTAVSTLLGSVSSQPTPAIYVNIFTQLCKSEKPLTMSMTYYDGGNLSAKKYTVDSFKFEPDSAGDYNYSIGLIEYTDIKPKQLNPDGSEVASSDVKVTDKIKFKNISNVKDFWNFCKQQYPVISKKLLWAFATYNGIRNFVFQSVVIGWKIKGSLQDLGGRFGILNNIIGVSKITSKDTAAVSSALKALSFSKASRQLAEVVTGTSST